MVQKGDGTVVSVIVPAYNERENIPPLLEEFSYLVEKDTNRVYELVLVDDGSTDGTFDTAVSLKDKYPFLRICKHRTNYGKTEAILTGLYNSTGDVIVIFDADLQYDPLEIPLLVEGIEQGFDVVCGWKQGHYEKRFVSSVYNALSRFLFHIPVHDQNAVKALRREVLEEIPFRRDWHRYIVVLAVNRGFKVGEVKVTLRPRRFGEPKYQGKWRIVIGFLDLVSVEFLTAFARKPMLLFGTLGGLSLFLGIVVGLVSLYLRFVLGVGFRPLLYLVMLLVISGLLLFAMGFLAEMLAMNYEKLMRLERLLKRNDKETP